MARKPAIRRSPERQLTRWLLVGAAPLVLFTISLSVWAYLRRSETTAANARFTGRAGELTGDLENAFADYFDQIEAVRGFVNSKPELSKADFHPFASQVMVRHSGLDAIAWAPANHLHQAAIAEPESAIARITPPYSAESGSLRAPAIRARDSGRIVSGPPLESIESGRVDIRLQMYAPVYAGDTRLPTVESRRRDFRGFVAAIVDMNKLVDSVLAEKGGDDLLLTLSDETTASISSQLYCCNEQLQAGSRTHDDYTMFAGRRWRIRFQSSQAFDSAAHSWQPFLVAGAGVLLSFAVGAVLWLTTQRAETFQRLVDERTADLQQANDQLRESTDQLAVSNKALEQSNTELQQYAYVASHDLQSPLRAVKAFSGMLKEDYRDSLDDHAAEYIDRIVDGVGRMQGMINDLLDYSRVESQGRPLSLASLKEIAEDAAAILDGVARDENGVIHIHDLPEVACDRRQMVQLLQNLIGNGLKYRGDADPIIHVTAQRGENEWIISVQDNGIGIDPKHHDQIFDIFRRLHSSSEYPGTGIGLAVCRRIVQRHNGRIWLESEKGAGCNFLFSIPDYEEHANVSPAKEAAVC